MFGTWCRWRIAGDGVTDGGHGPVRAAGAAGVLPEHDITDIMVHLDGPVAAQVSEQVSRAGLARREAGDAEDGDRAEQLPVRAVAVPLDEEHLLHVRPPGQDPLRRRQGLDGTDVDAAVAPVHGPGLAGDRSAQGSASAASNSRGWFSPMVKMKKAPAALIFRACPRCVCIWSALITAPSRSSSGILPQELAEDRDLIRFHGVHRELGGGSAVVPDPGQQHRRVPAPGSGAAQRLAVNPQVAAHAGPQCPGPGTLPCAQHVVVLLPGRSR